MNLEGWTIIDKNKNQFTVQNMDIKKDNFVVFHKNEIQEKLKEVNYQKIDFKISSVSEELYLYDNKGRLVDSISYELTDKNKSYSRNIPFDSFAEIKGEWKNNSDVTIGYHNTFYNNILLEKQKEKDRKRMFWIIGTIFVGIVSVIGIFIYRRKQQSTS